MKELQQNNEVVETVETAPMELFAADADYRELVTKAKELGIRYVQVKKDVLIEKVNEMITKINNGEVKAPEIEEPTYVDEVEDGAESGNPGNGTSSERRTVTRMKAPKWYEESNAFPYQDGDIVEIVSGKDLVGRKVMVKQPSAKKNALKGHLIHPITGELQKTFLSVDFDRIELREKAGQSVDQKAESQTEDQEAI